MTYQEEYARYRAMFAFDPETTRELDAISADEREIEDRFYQDLSFGTAGMRGVLGAGRNRMNVYVVRRATAALADYILEAPDQAARGVAIAFDSRRNSDVFAREAALVLAARGVKAFLFDSLRPVPVLSFTVRALHCIAGIVITASHNPAEYNGYKVYWADGGQMPPERASEIQRRIDGLSLLDAKPMDEAEAKRAGLLTLLGGEIDDRYSAMVEALCVNPELARDKGGALSIVYTPLHGSGNLPVRRVLRELGFTGVRVVPEQELPDPAFSTVRVPNPEDPAAFTLALKLQEALDADVVFGTDPDCDRVGVAVKDPSGKAHILSGNQIGCLLLHYILSQKQARGALAKNGAAVKSIVSTEMARAICADFGVSLIDVLTGFKYIAETIQRFEETGEHTFLFGFEESYGYLSGTQVRDKDGVNACMLIAEAALFYKLQGMTLYDALQALYARYGYFGERVVSVTLKGAQGLTRMREIMGRLRENPPKAFDGVPVVALRDYQASTRVSQGAVAPLTLPTSDVLYFELAGGAWICVRPSGTEPKIKLYVNAVTQSHEETDALLSCLAASAERMIND